MVHENNHMHAFLFGAYVAVVGTLGSAVVVEGSDCKVVHVEPDGSPPVWGVVLCVPLMGNGGGRKV